MNLIHVKCNVLSLIKFRSKSYPASAGKLRDHVTNKIRGNLCERRRNSYVSN